MGEEESLGVKIEVGELVPWTTKVLCETGSSF